jgi:hypothetical protein
MKNLFLVIAAGASIIIVMGMHLPTLLLALPGAVLGYVAVKADKYEELA